MTLLKKHPWLVTGVTAILAGYVLLARGDVTAAPLLLVVGYCILIPVYLLRNILDRSGE